MLSERVVAPGERVAGHFHMIKLRVDTCPRGRTTFLLFSVTPQCKHLLYLICSRAPRRTNYGVSLPARGYEKRGGRRGWPSFSDTPLDIHLAMRTSGVVVRAQKTRRLGRSCGLSALRSALARANRAKQKEAEQPGPPGPRGRCVTLAGVGSGTACPEARFRVVIVVIVVQ